MNNEFCIHDEFLYNIVKSIGKNYWYYYQHYFEENIIVLHCELCEKDLISFEEHEAMYHIHDVLKEHAKYHYEKLKVFL